MNQYQLMEGPNGEALVLTPDRGVMPIPGPGGAPLRFAEAQAQWQSLLPQLDTLLQQGQQAGLQAGVVPTGYNPATEPVPNTTPAFYNAPAASGTPAVQVGQKSADGRYSVVSTPDGPVIADSVSGVRYTPSMAPQSWLNAISTGTGQVAAASTRPANAATLPGEQAPPMRGGVVQDNIFGNPTAGERAGGAVTTGYPLPPTPGGYVAPATSAPAPAPAPTATAPAPATFAPRPIPVMSLPTNVNTSGSASDIFGQYVGTYNAPALARAGGTQLRPLSAAPAAPVMGNSNAASPGASGSVASGGNVPAPQISIKPYAAPAAEGVYTTMPIQRPGAPAPASAPAGAGAQGSAGSLNQENIVGSDAWNTAMRQRVDAANAANVAGAQAADQRIWAPVFDQGGDGEGGTLGNVSWAWTQPNDPNIATPQKLEQYRAFINPRLYQQSLATIQSSPNGIPAGTTYQQYKGGPSQPTVQAYETPSAATMANLKAATAAQGYAAPSTGGTKYTVLSGPPGGTGPVDSANPADQPGGGASPPGPPAPPSGSGPALPQTGKADDIFWVENPDGSKSKFIYKEGIPGDATHPAIGAGWTPVTGAGSYIPPTPKTPAPTAVPGYTPVPQYDAQGNIVGYQYINTSASTNPLTSNPDYQSAQITSLLMAAGLNSAQAQQIQAMLPYNMNLAQANTDQVYAQIRDAAAKLGLAVDEQKFTQAYQTAQLTGQLGDQATLSRVGLMGFDQNGNPTLATRQFQHQLEQDYHANQLADVASQRADAGLTGVYQGQETAQYQQQISDTERANLLAQASIGNQAAQIRLEELRQQEGQREFDANNALARQEADRQWRQNPASFLDQAWASRTGGGYAAPTMSAQPAAAAGTGPQMSMQPFNEGASNTASNMGSNTASNTAGYTPAATQGPLTYNDIQQSGVEPPGLAAVTGSRTGGNTYAPPSYQTAGGMPRISVQGYNQLNPLEQQAFQAELKATGNDPAAYFQNQQQLTMNPIRSGASYAAPRPQYR